MADQLQQLHELVQALVNALGFGLDVATVVEDLVLTGAEGHAIRSNLSLSGAPQKDCRRLILACKEYPNGMKSLQTVLKQHLDGKSSWPSLERALMAYTSSLEGTPHSTGTHNQKVYISYAWGDHSAEGQRRGQLAEDLCTALQKVGTTILRDREQIKPGDRISAFMQAIAKGDVIIVVLSNHYLESEYCMYELYGIWKQVCQDPDLFLQRVIPLTLPDAKLRTLEERLTRAEYWLKRKRDLDSRIANGIDAVGELTYSKYRLIKQFAEQTSDMLELLTDKYEPRDFERQVQEGFREVLDQILAARGG